ncbi:MAG: tetratricopeptide repeat protein [Bacteroidia bacterium]|jgi:two-component system sensor histidine kinase UhpB
MIRVFTCLMLFLLAFSTTAFSQNDSLLRMLKTGDAKSKLSAYPALSFALHQTNPDSALLIAQQGIAFAEGNNNVFHKASCLNMAGLAYNRLGRYTKCFQSYVEAIRLFEAIKEPAQVARVNDNLAQHLYLRKDYRQSQTFLLKALRYFESVSDSFRIAKSYQTLSIINRELKQYDESKSYLDKSINILTRQNKLNELGAANSLMGNLFIAMKKYEEAKPYHQKSYDLFLKTNDTFNQALALENLALVEENSQRYNEAADYYVRALNIFRNIKSETDVAYEQMRLAVPTGKQNKFANAHLLLDSAELIFRKEQVSTYLADLYQIRSQIFEDAGNTTKALEAYKKHISLRDSISEAQKTEEIQRLQTEYETDRKEQQIALLKAEGNAQESEISRRNWLIFSLVLLVAVIVALSVVVYNQALVRKERKRQQELNRIAGDLHDDVGASLSAIRMYSEMLKSKGEQSAPQLSPIAARISDNAREIIQNMSDIVWAIKPGEEGFSALQNRVWNTALAICEAREISLNFTATEELKEWKPDIELRNDMFLVCKEAVNNAVKYSGSNKLDVAFSVENNTVKISIRDYGNGLPEQHREGNGLKNMEQRTLKHKGVCERNNHPDGGLFLKFSFPVN